MNEQGTLVEDTSSIEQDLAQAIISILETTNSPAIQRAREVIAHRLAVSGDVAPSRIPGPRNITEVGGYINLLTEYGEIEQRSRMIAAALGIAGPQVSLPQPGALPPLTFVTRNGARPAGSQQASFPLNFTIRSDFSPAFDSALEEIAHRGGSVPFITPLRILPALGSAEPLDGSAQLDIIGRSLSLVPTAALRSVETDPLSLSRPSPGGAFEVLVRVIDSSLPGVVDISSEDWTSWQCSGTECFEADSTDQRFALAPILNQAGWHQPQAPTNPMTLMDQGTWAKWLNITGLIPGVTRFGQELQLLYSAQELVRSSVFGQLEFVWSGTEFAPPGE